MVVMFFFFGYQKWWSYEAQTLIPFISNGPLIAWMYPAFGIRGASWFLGVAEWLFGALLLGGFWSRQPWQRNLPSQPAHAAASTTSLMTKVRMPSPCFLAATTWPIRATAS